MLDLGHDIFRDYLVTARYKQLEHAQKRRNENVTFMVGDLVMYQRRSWKKNLSQKLQTIWRGPYQVTEIDEHGNLRLNMPRKYSRHLVFAPDMVKHSDNHPENLHKFVLPMDNKEIEYPFERISDHRTTKNGKQYLVHRKGYDEEKNTWEPAKIIVKDALEAVKEYKEVLAELGESPMDMDSE